MHDTLKLDNQLCFRLYTASRLVTQAYRPLLEPLGLTYPQYLVMMVLWEKDHQLVGDIVKRLVLDTNTVTPLLQRMEKESFISRVRGTDDGRQTVVSLTRKGKLLEKKALNVPACMTQHWQNDSPDLDDVMRTTMFLDKIIDTLKK